jgi:hypothetical protein
MKRHIIILIAAGIFAFTAISCNNENTGTDNTDTATLPAETTVPAGAPASGSTDTSITAPVDPAMDTSANQTPKM